MLPKFYVLNYFAILLTIHQLQIQQVATGYVPPNYNAESVSSGTSSTPQMPERAQSVKNGKITRAATTFTTSQPTDNFCSDKLGKVTNSPPKDSSKSKDYFNSAANEYVKVGNPLECVEEKINDSMKKTEEKIKIDMDKTDSSIFRKMYFQSGDKPVKAIQGSDGGVQYIILNPTNNGIDSSSNYEKNVNLESTEEKLNKFSMMVDNKLVPSEQQEISYNIDSLKNTMDEFEKSVSLYMNDKSKVIENNESREPMQSKPTDDENIQKLKDIQLYEITEEDKETNSYYPGKDGAILIDFLFPYRQTRPFYHTSHPSFVNYPSSNFVGHQVVYQTPYSGHYQSYPFSGYHDVYGNRYYPTHGYSYRGYGKYYPKSNEMVGNTMSENDFDNKNTGPYIPFHNSYQQKYCSNTLQFPKYPPMKRSTVNKATQVKKEVKEDDEIDEVENKKINDNIWDVINGTFKTLAKTIPQAAPNSDKKLKTSDLLETSEKVLGKAFSSLSQFPKILQISDDPNHKIFVSIKQNDETNAEELKEQIEHENFAQSNPIRSVLKSTTHFVKQIENVDKQNPVDPGLMINTAADMAASILGVTTNTKNDGSKFIPGLTDQSGTIFRPAITAFGNMMNTAIKAKPINPGMIAK